MTSFFAVHLVLVIVSLVLGTAIGVLGVRGIRAVPGDIRVADERRRVGSP